MLATEPHLGKQISINTGQTINPDLDIHPTGRFTIAPASSSIDTRTGLPMLSAVHDAEGQALSTITTERLGLLRASFKTQQQMPATVTTHSFEEAVAKLLHRYKEGRTSGKYTVNMRNYWTTPDSLVKVMTAGLSTEQERFASPLDFNPSFGRYSPLLLSKRIACLVQAGMPTRSSGQAHHKLTKNIHQKTGRRLSDGPLAPACKWPSLA